MTITNTKPFILSVTISLLGLASLVGCGAADEPEDTGETPWFVEGGDEGSDAAEGEGSDAAEGEGSGAAEGEGSGAEEGEGSDAAEGEGSGAAEGEGGGGWGEGG